MNWREILSGTKVPCKARGQQLFSYLKQYLDLGIPSTKQVWELVVAEADAFENHLAAIDPIALPKQAAKRHSRIVNGILAQSCSSTTEDRRKNKAAGKPNFHVKLLKVTHGCRNL